MDKKVKYNLTFWQKVDLIILRLFWLAADPDKRKSWHHVKKGMEKHEHKFTIPKYISGVKFMKCEHEGCNIVDDPSIKTRLTIYICVQQ